MKTSKQKRTLNFIIIGIGMIIILPFIIWIAVFYQSDFSNNPQDWSVFASFTKGTVGTLVSILNLVVVIYLATIVRAIQKKEDKTSLATELHKEWNGEVLYRSRNETYKFFLKNKNIDLEEISQNKDFPNELFHFYMIQGFFERLHAIIIYDKVDIEIAINLFGEAFIFWDKFIFKEKTPAKWPSRITIDDLREKIIAKAEPKMLQAWIVNAHTYFKK